jgi:succinate dehydrogenase / fumarate reductase flavoprotein subunit
VWVTRGLAVYLDFAEAIRRDGEDVIFRKYGNLFQMYEMITDVDPMKEPMLIYPAVHYTMGGLWVDYNLMTTIPGLFALGECNFSDHGANRLGASALMQGLADGYFVISTTVANYFGSTKLDPVATDHVEFSSVKSQVSDRLSRILANSGKRTESSVSVDEVHKELGRLLWDNCGLARNAAGLTEALEKLPSIRESFWNKVYIPVMRTILINRWSGPAGLPISWSLANLCCATPWPATSRAAATCVRKVRPRTMKPCAMTNTTATSPYGNTSKTKSR